jgi:predicted RNase H-like nuclease (RuvC/YqgF family)
MSLPLIIAVIAAVSAPIGAYLVAARQFSGKVQTSDAAKLWEESRAIRDWATNRMKDLSAHVDKLEERVRELEEHNGSLTVENLRLHRELEECKQKLSA